METKANYTLIGAFTLGIIAAAFAFVFWFSGARSVQRNTYSVIFNGSVSGLTRGSQVLFNGLRVGEVTLIDIMENDPSRVEAMISVSTRAKVTSDTRARLEFQGLTGVAAIALTGGSATADNLKPVPGTLYPIIFAERSDLQNLLETVQRLSTKADSIMEKADSLLGTNSAAINQTVQNVETFSRALSDNSAGVNTFLTSMADVGRALSPLSVKLEALSGDIDLLVKSVEPDRVRATVANVEKFTGALAGNEGSINAMLADAAAAAKKLSETSVRLDTVLASANEVMKGIDPARLTAAIDGVARVATSGAKVLDAVDPARVSTLVANADVFAAALAKNASSIDALMADAAGAAKQLNAASGRLDGVLAGAGETLKALDGARLSAALDDIGKLAASGAKVVGAVDPDKVRTMIDSASAFSTTLARNEANINDLLADAAGAARQLNASSGKLDAVLASAGETLKALDAAKIRSAVDDFSRTAASAAQVAREIDPDKVRNMIDSASAFADVLEKNQANINNLLADAALAAKNLGGASGKLDGVLDSAADTLKALDAAKIRSAVDDFSRTAASAAQVARSVDPDRVRSMIDNASAFTDVLEKNQANINNLLADAAIAARNLGVSSGKLDGVLTGASDVIKGLDPAKISGVVDNVVRFTGTLDANRENIDVMLRDATTLATKLNASADRIDGVLKGLDGFLGGNNNSKGMFNDIAEAAKAIRKLADNLDGRTREITSGINRFTGTGFREYEALAADGRRTLNDLNRAVRSLERNPSQLIFGGKPAIPEYKGGQ